MHSRGSFVLLCAALALGLCGGAWGATHKVTPADDVNALVNSGAFAGGDTVSFGAGVYTQAINVPGGKANVRFKGSKKVFFDTGAQIATSDDGTQISGLVFRQCNDCIVITGANAVISKCSFFAGSDTIAVTGDNLLVQSCLFRGATDPIAYTGNGGRVLKNRCDQISGTAFAIVTGNNFEGSGNRFTAGMSTGFDVTGNNANCSKNRWNSLFGVGVNITGDDAIADKNRFAAIVGVGVFFTGEGGRADGNVANGIVGVGVLMNATTAGGTANKNRFAGLTGSGIQVQGTGGSATGNRVFGNGAGTGVFCLGDDQVVSGNTVTGIGSGQAIGANGNNVTFTKNKASSVGAGVGLNLTGDDFIVDGNSAAECQIGMMVTGNATVSGAATITKTKVSACNQGLLLTGNDVRVEKGQFLDCGTHDEPTVSKNGAAVLVQGNANTLIGLKVTNSGGDGFGIDGDDNLLQKCTADGCASNAFDIEDADIPATPNTPDSNLLEDCKGTNCGGQGLDNNGTLTSVTGCTFSGNLLDVGKSGGASYGTFSGNKIGDGSNETSAELVD